MALTKVGYPSMINFASGYGAYQPPLEVDYLVVAGGGGGGNGGQVWRK